MTIQLLRFNVWPMMLNKYDRHYKQFIAYREEYWDIVEQINNMPLIPYEKPVQKGWVVNYELRADILAREDSPYILAAMKAGYKPQYITSVKHVRMMRAGHKGYWIQHPRSGRQWVKFGPRESHVTQKEYDKLHPAVQRYFYLDRFHLTRWYRDKYRVILPEYWLTPKARPHFLTHYRDINPQLESRRKWLKTKLEDYWRIYSDNYRRQLPYPQHRERASTRATIQKFKTGEVQDIQIVKFHN
jgi:hypothetical protein